MKRLYSYPLPTIGLLTLIVFLLRATSLDAQSLWRDEVDALCYALEFPHLISQALAPEADGSLNTPHACPSLPVPPATSPSESVSQRLSKVLEGIIRQNGPLYFLLLRGWMALTGTSEYAMRFFSLLWGVLCVPLTYVLGKRLFDCLTGTLAALLVTTSPYLTWYSQEVKMYTLLPALTLTAIYGLRRAVVGDGWHWWIVQIVATSLAFYSHILAALLIPVQVVLFFLWWPQARRQWLGGSVSLACLALPYLPLITWQAQSMLQVRETGYQHYTLIKMAEILLNGWSLGIACRGWPWGTVFIGALAVGGLIISLTSSTVSGRLDGKRNGLALFCWLALPTLVIWVISRWQPLFTDRYVIWAAPAFYLLIALGLSYICKEGAWGRWAMSFLVGAILVFHGVNLWQQATQPIKSDFRAVASYVADRYTPGDLILFQIPHGRYTFDYYFSRDGYPWIGGPYTNHRNPDGSFVMSRQDVATEMQKRTSGRSAAWLIATEVTMWDQRKLTEAWLNNNWDRVEEAHFARVDVYRYIK